MALGGSFSISGLISGFETDTIIEKLIDLQKGTVKSLESQKATNDARLTAIRSLNAKVLALRVESDRLQDTTSFEVTKAESSSPETLAVTAKSTAISGTYQVTVKKLAQAHQVISQGYESSSASVLGTGTVTLSIGGAAYSPIEIDSSTDSLDELAAAINAADMNIKATVINDGSDVAPYRLVLTGTTTGATATVAMTTDLTGGTDPTMGTLQAAQDAEVVLGDAATAITVKSSKNTLDNLIEGVSLNLKKADADTPITVKVDADTNAVRAMIDDFMTAYNDLMKFIKDVTFYDPATKTAGPLQGDRTVGLLQNDLVRMTTGQVIGNGFHSLAELGITLDKTGRLIDSDPTLLSNAVSDNLSKVSEMFANTETGLGKILTGYLDTVTDSVDGILTLQDKDLVARQADIEKSLETQNEYFLREENRIRDEFGRMEAAMAAYQAQSQFLAANLAASTGQSSQQKK